MRQTQHSERRALCAAVAGAILAVTAAAHEPAAHDPPGAATETRFITNRDGRDLPLTDEEEGFFFVVFGDRTGGPPEGGRVLDQAVRDANLLDPDLVMTVGDLVQGYNQTGEWMAQMREFRSIMDGLKMPWYPVAGNHDIYWRGDGRPEREHEPHYEEHFGPLWYAFEHKDSWFIVLYSDEGNPETGERNFTRPESNRMSREQFAWLKETLARAAEAEHVFVFLHHPRWLGGQYGDDWDKVHRALVDAGNVTAVFAGHIHHMRYDGPRDGIEYVTLATVGGVQTGKAPAAGYLHQFHIVTVRPDRVSMSSIPVGEVMDVRAITGEVSEAARRLADVRPQFDGRLAVSRSGGAGDTLAVTVANPVDRPVEITLHPESRDSRWIVRPDHVHKILQPGEDAGFKFRVDRMGDSLDHAFRLPRMALDIDYLAEAARFPIPRSTTDFPLRLDLPTPPAPEVERVLTLDGEGDCLEVPSDLIHDPDGPLTLECWFRARSFGRRTGLVAKTENSDYGFFVSRGVPQFSIFLGDGYVEPRAATAVLETGRWHHIAGVYDGEEVRLYLDGELIDARPADGPRRTNAMPMYIGADVDSRANPMSFFDGAIDEVRLSTTARYAGETFTPERRFTADEETSLLLHMDGTFLRWVVDASRNHAHPTLLGDATIEDVSR